MQFINKVFTISYHKFYKREFWESLMEHSPFDRPIPFGHICEEFVSTFHSMMVGRNLQVDDYQVSFSFSEDGQLDMIQLYCFLVEEDVEINTAVIKNDKHAIKKVEAFLNSLMERNIPKQICRRNHYRYLLIEQRELITLLNLFYQYICDSKIKVTRQNENDTIEFFVYDHLSDTEKKEELFSAQLMENYHPMRSITKIERVTTNRTIREDDCDKVLILKEIVNYSTILNFYNGHFNIVGKAVPYQDGSSNLKSLFSFQFNGLMKNYKILDGHQGLLLEF
ncbi:hypothetical protein CON65_03720 [Bacillus pseudomycoides]|uniref:Uncharacterized protein n=1 Tax=Bacillus pseudomycoides TaxID=64104 RepID=A0AA91ZUS0_9BACI|nr:MULTISPECIES: hypothetical protein [Bacillus]PEB54324.1 hypothetical protein COO03_05560 [Bacillus sp. AFS098217]PED83995.1 hypothetical protein CON65_03720 [Bacillus pseudomycoides]PEU06632.1 hypothetical protein CN524_22900 [Bacillus sp. AFS019443]